jgi:hypothetical protein
MNGAAEVKKILQCATFMALVAAMILGLHRLGLPHYEADEGQLVATILRDPSYVEALVLGNSHARRIRLDVMGYNGENLSSGGLDQFEIGYQVERLLPRLTQLKIVFVSLSYHSFYFDNTTSRIDGANPREGRRIKLYAQMPFSVSFVDGDYKNYLKGILYPVVTADHWQAVLEDPFAPLPAVEPKQAVAQRPGSIAAARRSIARAKTEQTAALLKKSSRKECRFFLHVADNMELQSSDIPARALEATLVYTDLLVRRGVRVVYFTPPFFPDYKRCIRAEMKKTTRRYMALVRKRTGAEYYDFSSDPEFVGNPALFSNSDHLNGLGGKLLSLRLREEVDAHAPDRGRAAAGR